jgi:hypothetical protein
MILNWIAYFIGIYLIFVAVGIGRSGKSIINLFGKNWWEIVFLVILAVILIGASHIIK